MHRPGRALILAPLLACGDATGEASTAATSETSAPTTATVAATGGVEDSSGAAAVTGEITGTDTTTAETGDPTAVPSTGEPPPPAFVQIDPVDPRRLTWRGQPFYAAGYYPGAAFNMTGPDFGGDYLGFHTAVMDALAAGGVNYFRVWINWGNVGNASAPIEDQWDRHILHPYQRTGPGEAVDGAPKFDLDAWNPDYFTWLAAAVDLAGDRDLVVQVILLDCWHAGFGLQYGFGELDYFAAGNNINGLAFADEAAWLDTAGPVFARHRAFVERVVDTLGERDNLVWETCNEKRAGSHATPDDTRMDAWHAAIADVVRAREAALGLAAHRLIMPVDLPEHRTVAGHETPKDGGESIADMRARLADEQFAWGLPLISDNDCCPGEPDADAVRVKAWAALTAGAHVDVFNNEMFKSAVLGNANTAAGIRSVGLVAAFVRTLAVELAGMTPNDGLVSGDAWTYARPGEEYVVYLPNGGQVEIPGLPPASARWWDPREGGAQDAGSGPIFVAPGPGDWALHVRVL